MSNKDILVQLRSTYLEDYKRAHYKEERRVIFKKMEDLSRTGEFQSWSRFAAALLAGLDKSSFDIALSEYDEAIALDPTFAYPWNGKGNALAQLKKYDDALAAYDKAIALDPTFAYPWNGRGGVLNELKKYDDALGCFDKAIALDAAYASPWNGRGNALGQLKKYDDALAAYDKAIALDATFAYPWNGKGNVLRNLKRYDDALACFDKAIALDPTELSPQYNRALTLFHNDRLEEAHAEFKALLTLDLPPELASLASLWVERISRAVKAAKQEKGEAEKGEKGEEARKEEVLAAALTTDIYQKLADLRLLEEVEKSRNEMKEALAKALGAPRRIGGASEDGTLFVLRDWNSYTPLLPPEFRPQSLVSPATRLGGGYFLTWRGHGVAIDPGIDFVVQLYKKKLSIADVDSVVVTHCHLDHTRDLEALVDLNYRFNENNNARLGADAFRELRFFLSPAAHSKYAEYLKHTRCCSQPELMYGGKDKKQVSDHIEVRPIRGFHKDITSEDEAIGLVLTLKKDGGEPLLVGLTSDSRSDPSLAEQFAGCHVLIAHLGTIETAKELLGNGLKNHLGLKGCFDLGQKVQPKLLIIGEFGEELLESRLEIIRVMVEYKAENTACILGADSNLAIGLGGELSVLCCHPSCKQLPTKILLKDVMPTIGEDGLFRYYCSKHSI